MSWQRAQVEPLTLLTPLSPLSPLSSPLSHLILRACRSLLARYLTAKKEELKPTRKCVFW